MILFTLTKLKTLSSITSTKRKLNITNMKSQIKSLWLVMLSVALVCSCCVKEASDAPKLTANAVNSPIITPIQSPMLSMSTSWYVPRGLGKTINSGQTIWLFADSCYVTGADSLFFKGMQLSYHASQPSSFESVTLIVNGDTLKDNWTYSGGLLTVMATQLGVLKPHSKFGIRAKCFGVSGISFYMTLEGVSASKYKNGQYVPVENVPLPTSLVQYN
jgi:hypothetical protein